MKLLVVDDHPIVVAACKTLFASDREIVVSGANTAADARADIAGSYPDIVIVDLNLPDASGLEFIRTMAGENPSLRMILFSVTDDPRIAREALSCGARGCVCKLGETDELREAVFAVARGETWLSERVSGMGDREADGHFNSREQEVLRQLSNGKNVVEIATALGVSYSTVAKLQSALRDRYNARSIPELIRIATELKFV